MGKIYIDQENLKLIVDCGIDISTATTLKIMWIKPDETDGELAATMVPGSTTKIQYIFTGASFVDQAGKYTIRAFADGSDGEIYGENDYFYVHEL